MAKELRKYNELRVSQQRPTASRQYSQKPNMDPEQSYSQEAQAFSES